ncbi:hypothetical protein [Candidatus Palauibacter sp.]|uniref:hypothetical protein n=1 Tax=Candidatus Palauibacter sp. TaxID=3101350 RepID=UPI003AF235A0
MRLRLAGRGAAALVAAIAAGCAGGGDPASRGVSAPSVASAAASVAGYRVLEPGAFIAGFPADPLDMGSEFFIERAWDLAVGAGADEIYVLDTQAKHVLRLDRDAKLRAVIGGPGGGPGEFEYAYSIEADPRGGVWVADLRLARLSRFDPDGRLLEEMRVPQLVRGFAVLPDGAVLYRKFDGRTASLAVQSGGDAVDFAGDLPPELAPDDVRSLWAEYDLEFAVVAPDTVVAFRNTDVRAYGAWRIALDIASARITGIAPVAFPAWLTEAIAAQAEDIERESREKREGIPPGAGSSFIPFSRGVRMSVGNLWVTPHSAANLVLATTIPLSAGDSVSVVARGHLDPRSGCAELDFAVLGERLAVLCMDQVRVYELLPAAPGPPPFAAGWR